MSDIAGRGLALVLGFAVNKVETGGFPQTCPLDSRKRASNQLALYCFVSTAPYSGAAAVSAGSPLV